MEKAVEPNASIPSAVGKILGEPVMIPGVGNYVSFIDAYFSLRNSGFRVNQARAGKKTIGTASPGKSSGFLTDKERKIDIGIITAANEIIEIRIWKNTIPLFPFICSCFYRQPPPRLAYKDII